MSRPMHAMHALCRREGAGWTNYVELDAGSGVFGSGWWKLTDDEVARLEGGWLYFHQSSRTGSTFAGRILGLDRRENGKARLRVLPRGDVPEVAWRGGVAGLNPILHRRIVEATYPHELASASLGASAP